MMHKIRVLVVDDHTLFRDGICALLALTPDMDVVGEAGNGREALQKVRELSPDVVLMDIGMPVMDGLEAARRIHERYPGTKVVIVSQFEDREHVLDAFDAGVQGFIEKTAASSELAAGVRSVSSGESFLSPTAARLLVEEFQHTEHRHAEDPYQRLTEREREILRLVAEGYTTQEIADMLVVSSKTVEGHRCSLMAKLGVHDRIGLVKYALRKGIISV
jgi:DNA-binding NarL/FixJ family response regulator